MPVGGISTASPFVHANSAGDLVVAAPTGTDDRFNLIAFGVGSVEYPQLNFGIPDLALQAAVGLNVGFIVSGQDVAGFAAVKNSDTGGVSTWMFDDIDVSLTETLVGTEGFHYFFF